MCKTRSTCFSIYETLNLGWGDIEMDICIGSKGYTDSICINLVFLVYRLTQIQKCKQANPNHINQISISTRIFMKIHEKGIIYFIHSVIQDDTPAKLRALKRMVCGRSGRIHGSDDPWILPHKNRSRQRRGSAQCEQLGS